MDTHPTGIVPLSPTRRWWGLLVLALPALIVSMDQNVLYLALPELSRELTPTLVEQLWMMDVYGLMVAMFLIPLGAVSDRWGHRRVLLLGAAAFAGCSVLAAFAPTSELLIAARALLGVPVRCSRHLRWR